MEASKYGQYIELSGALKHELRTLIRDEVWLNEIAVKSRNWGIKFLDDIGIHEEDAQALAQAINLMNCQRFYVVPIVWITCDNSIDDYGVLVENKAYVFDATEDGIEAFQGDNWDAWPLNLTECVFFDEAVSFVVLRTGDVTHTLYAGIPEFLEMACSSNEYWQDITNGKIT